ncbi:MAG: peptidoglycan DD-metalloendopeptidase family protein [Acidimicrobiia bacterium]|nr:peptidoglycan DD-metalloendopeptidase family protein [Acidimicrobiia bacterium]
MTRRGASRILALALASLLFASFGMGTAFAEDPPPDPPPAEEEPPAEEPPAEEPPADEPPAEEPPADEPPADEPPAEEPPADEPPAEEPPADEPPAEEPPAEEPPAEEPPADAGDPDAEAQDSEEEVEFDPTDPEQVFREIVFPVVGATAFSPGFGDCRDGCTRLHNGVDILTFGWKGVPVVASHDGRVIRTRTEGRLSGCSVTVEAEDGWTSHYIHLNNDLPGTDIEGHLCFAPGIEVGAEVTAGTLLGWVGDSGNAEETTPHLHFEIRNPDGIPVDSWYSLVDARHVNYQLLDTAGVASLAASLFDEEEATTAFVAALDDMQAVAESMVDVLEAPLITFDPDEPQPTLDALRALEPERVVVFASDPDSVDLGPLVEFSETLAVVEFSDAKPDETTEDDETSEDPVSSGPLPVEADPAPEPPPTTEEEGDAGDDGEPSPVHEAVAASTVIMIAGVDRTVLEEAPDHPQLVATLTSTTPPTSIGDSIDGKPRDEANRNAFWWPSASGWLLTEELPESSPTTIAYVADPSDAATISFLASQSVAPPMPLWHHQPTSRTVKSL